MRLLMLGLVIALVAVGCGGGSDEQTAPLRTGVYEYELTEQYLLDSGISEHQAATESGAHTTMLSEDGTFVDSWRTAEGRTAPAGHVRERPGEPRHLQVDERMLRRLGDVVCGRGRQVTWSDQKPLPPYESDEDQKVTEVFNSVPWTRVGEAS